jgi:hypothetical protein
MGHISQVLGDVPHFEERRAKQCHFDRGDGSLLVADGPKVRRLAMKALRCGGEQE